MTGRDQALDGLRGIAILLVLACHLLQFQPTSLLTTWLNLLSKSLWIGVDLFFVLSGFLITGILIRTRQHAHRVRNFYVRRTLRIFPAYYLMVLATVSVVWAFHSNPRIVEDTLGFFPSLLVFGQNIVSSISPERPMLRELTPLWSLAVEEQFYLFWPWLVWRCKPENLSKLCLGLLATALISKFGMVLAGVQAPAIYHLTLSRMDTLAVGALLATWHAAGRPLPRWTRLLPVLAGLGLVALFIGCRGLRMSEGALVIALATAATPFLCGGILQASLAEAGALRRALSIKVLVFFGTYSYGLHLVHFIADAGVKLALTPQLSPHWQGNRLMLLLAAISVVASVLMALLLHRLVEAPALRLKARFAADAPAPLNAAKTIS